MVEQRQKGGSAFGSTKRRSPICIDGDDFLLEPILHLQQ